jgi:hypothetical protein
MPRHTKLSVSRKKARKQRHYWGSTSVAGFLETPPDPPPVTPRIYSSVTSSSLVETGTQTLSLKTTYTQTEHRAMVDKEVQVSSMEPQLSFFKDMLSLAQHKLLALEQYLFCSQECSKTFFAPFLLPYSLMAILILNLRKALHSIFLQNTNFRRLFLHYLCQGFQSDLSLLASILGFAEKTLQRALKEEITQSTPLIGETVAKKQRKTRIRPAVLADARKILDVLAPVKSGKVFRVVSCTLNFLYEQYRGSATQLHPKYRPVSYSFFIDKILDVKHNYVHFENNPDFCPLCRDKDELELIPTANRTTDQNHRLTLLQGHDRMARCQWKAYHQIMEGLVNNPNHRIVVQDFNQQHANTSLQTQVLTLVAYGAPSGYLERHYYNYFLPKEQSNNITAVIACHRNFFQNPQLSFIFQATHIDVFNDGGPKHFKLTGYLAHMAKMAELLALRNTTIVQHYFASYHGSGPADAVASHMKRKLRNIRANFRHNPASVKEMAQICADIENTDLSCAITVPPELLLEESQIAVDTFDGIKAHHKATFGANQVVALWTDSICSSPAVVKALDARGILI